MKLPLNPMIASAFAFALAIGTVACGAETAMEPDSRGDAATADVQEDDIKAADDTGDGATDITNAVLTKRAGSCADFVGAFTASVTDTGQSKAFTGALDIAASGGDCTFTGNGIPNHDFNKTGNFATPVSETNEVFKMTATPTASGTPTGLTLQSDNAIFLNGVKLDLLAAACYGVGNEALGEEKIGCFQTGVPWRYDPMHPGNAFGTDSHNAHTQPDGGYHYHGDPGALYDATGAAASGVIGFAADGFPIFGPYFNDGTTVRRATSGYTLKPGARVSQAGEGAFPGGDYDGTYIDDYEWAATNGDLDACNGMTVDGVYGYYITDTYPWVMRCFTGTPDASFKKSGP